MRDCFCYYQTTLGEFAIGFFRQLTNTKLAGLCLQNVAELLDEDISNHTSNLLSVHTVGNTRKNHIDLVVVLVLIRNFDNIKYGNEWISE